MNAETTGAEALALHDERAVLKHIVMSTIRGKMGDWEKTVQGVAQGTGIPVDGLKKLIRPFVYKAIDEFFAEK